MERRRSAELTLPEVADLKKKLSSLKTQIRNALDRTQDGYFSKPKGKQASAFYKIHEARVIDVGAKHLPVVCWGSKSSPDLCFAASSEHIVQIDPTRADSLQQQITTDLISVFSMDVEAEEGEILACAGIGPFDLYIFKTQYPEATYDGRPEMQLAHHAGMIESVRFMNKTKVLTASDDLSIAIFDLESVSRLSIRRFMGHTDAVNCVAVSPSNENIFASGSTDSTCKIWDTRVEYSVLTFRNHVDQVNEIVAFPDGNSFVTAAEDKTCRLLDMRSCNELNLFTDESQSVPVNTVGVSQSGALVFSHLGKLHAKELMKIPSRFRHAVNGNEPVAFSTLDPEAKFMPFSGKHSKTITTMSVHRQGKALMTGAEDGLIKFWS